MEFLMDNQDTERLFRQIIKAIPSMQNGITSESMAERGIIYEKNWGASIVDLKHFSVYFEKNHLLALKLWNKKWRETMILATLIDKPEKVSEEQMDFWVKSSENAEVIEQAVTNLFIHTPYAFAKSIEWCRGKKYLVKFAGLLMMGRLALTSNNAIDEMFEPLFDVIPTLAKDKALYLPISRSICQVSRRSEMLRGQCENLANSLINSGNENAGKLGHELIVELNC